MDNNLFEKAFIEIQKLVQKFENNKEHFISPSYLANVGFRANINKFKTTYCKLRTQAMAK